MSKCINSNKKDKSKKKIKKRKHDYIKDDKVSEIKYNYPKEAKSKKKGWK